MKRTRIVTIVAAVVLGAGTGAQTMPADWGTGWYWTDFTTEFDAQPFTADNWRMINTDSVNTTATFTVSGGVLTVTCANNLDRPAAYLFDPGVDYSQSGTQEVLIRISASSISGNVQSGGNGNNRAGPIVRASINEGDPYYAAAWTDVTPARRFSGYEITYRNLSARAFWLTRNIDNYLTNQGSEVSYGAAGAGTWGPEDWYWMRIVSDETGVRAWVWQDGTDESAAWSFDRDWVWSSGTFTNGTGGSGVSPDGGLAGISANGSVAFQVSHFQLKVSDFAPLPRIPEPATMSLLALGGLAMLRRRYDR